MNIPKLQNVKPLEDYKILLSFENCEDKIFDVSPYISGDWFGKLKDTQYFNTVHVSGKTVEWLGGQDIAPHELYELSTTIN